MFVPQDFSRARMSLDGTLHFLLSLNFSQKSMTLSTLSSKKRIEKSTLKCSSTFARMIAALTDPLSPDP